MRGFGDDATSDELTGAGGSAITELDALTVTAVIDSAGALAFDEAPVGPAAARTTTKAAAGRRNANAAPAHHQRRRRGGNDGDTTRVAAKWTECEGDSSTTSWRGRKSVDDEAVVASAGGPTSSCRAAMLCDAGCGDDMTTVIEVVGMPIRWCLREDMERAGMEPMGDAGD